MAKTIIFTDLDGSLLDDRTYSFEQAKPALELLKARDIPLVLCTSKTRAETEAYRQRLRNSDPFIVENGGAIYVPMGYFLFLTGSKSLGESYIVSEFGTSYEYLRQEFVLTREELAIDARGFGDLAPEEIARLTGLPVHEAVLAKQREFSEPFLIKDGDADRFLQAVEARGLRWTKGRLHCLMGDHDKGKVVQLLKWWYEIEYGRVETIGLGDSLNDLPMLRSVDHPVLIRKADNSYTRGIEAPGLYRTEQPGPLGWNEAVLRLLQR